MRNNLYNQITRGTIQKIASDENPIDPEKLASIADELKAFASEGIGEKIAEENQDDVAIQNERENEEAAEEARTEEDLEEAQENEEAPGDESATGEIIEDDIENEEAVPAEAIIEEAIADAEAEGAPEEGAPEEGMPAEGTPEYEQLMAMLAEEAAGEKMASTRKAIDIFEKIAAEEEKLAFENSIADGAEKLASEVISDVFEKLELPLSKYAGLFVEDEKTALLIGEQAEKLASESGVTGLQAVEDIINQMTAGE